jgi:hypothetical protein
VDRDTAHLGVAGSGPHASTMTPRTTTTTTNPGPIRFLAAAARRWPTFLGVALGADTVLDEITDATTHRYAEVLPLLPLLYVVLAVLRRPRASWPVLLVLLAGYGALELQDRVETSVVVLAAALAATIWGAGHGRHRDADFRLQVAGMVAFGALAVGGLLVDPDLGRYLVAAGWLGHGVWDWVHLARNRVVARSYAEWCGALDVMVGVALLAGPLL